MDLTEFKCIFNAKEYSIYEAKYHTYLQPISITVIQGPNTIQAFTYLHNRKTIISYTTKSIETDLITVLYAYINQANYPLPNYSIGSIPSIIFNRSNSQSYTDTLIFSTLTYSFRVTIKEEMYHYAIKIGGKEFMGCVELFIDKPEHPFYKASKLAQVYSEPECWYQLGKKGKTVDLLKGSFQLCQMLFGVNIFCFNDNSNIECSNVSSSKEIPRIMEKPFSLAHLSLAKTGLTWYEHNFNAFLRNKNRRKEYEEAILRLGNKSAALFESFAALNNLRKDQYDYLKPLYEASSSWSEFFNKIPKEKQCTMLFNWLPAYLDNHILKFEPTKHEWCIYLEPLGISEKEEIINQPTMERTDMLIQMIPNEIRQWGGRFRRSRKFKDNGKTRKQKTVLLYFRHRG